MCNTIVMPFYVITLLSPQYPGTKLHTWEHIIYIITHSWSLGGSDDHCDLYFPVSLRVGLPGRYICMSVKWNPCMQ